MYVPAASSDRLDRFDLFKHLGCFEVCETVLSDETKILNSTDKFIFGGGGDASLSAALTWSNFFLSWFSADAKHSSAAVKFGGV